MKLLLGFVIVCSLIFCSIPIVKKIQFDVGCQSYLKSASDDPSIELAKIDLDIALKYLEDKGLTNGYSYYIIKDRQSDIGFWYNRLKIARLDLDNFNDESSGLETSNVLMKLRETILDNNEVLCPDGISMYPYHRWFMFLFMIGAISLLFSFIVILTILEG